MENMDNPVEAIRSAFIDLSDSVPGLAVSENTVYDLRISNPILVLWLQRLNNDIVNTIPRPPNPFNSQTTLIGNHVPAPIPWISSANEYAKRYLIPHDEFFVTFANYGKTRSGTRASTHDRRAKLHVEQKQDALSELGIDPEQQIIIPLDGRIRERIVHRLTAYYLATRGWVVSTDFLYLPQLGRGTPDIVAWRSPFTEAMKRAGLIRNGALIEELVYLQHLNRDVSDGSVSLLDTDPSETLVGEAKGGSRSLGEAHRQLKKYLDWDVFNSGYCVVPGYRGNKLSGAGTLTFDTNGFDLQSDRTQHHVTEDRQQFLESMDTAASQALLCGLSYSSLINLATAERANDLDSPYDLAVKLLDIDHETIINRLITELQKSS